MLYVVVTNWLPAPVGDEWGTPGMLFESWCRGTLSFGDFFAQHNESRKLFPRLLYLLLAQFGGWDVRKEISLVFAIGCAVTALFYLLIRQLPGSSKRVALVAWVTANFLCFSAVQIENFLWGIQLEPFFPGAALLAAAAVNMSGLPLRWKCLINATLAFVATYTFAHGMLLWALAIPLLSRRELLSCRQVVLLYVIYALAAALAVGTYFIGYVHPAHHPALLGARNDIAALAHYVILWIGSYFASGQLSALTAGMIVSALFLTANLFAAVWILRGDNWRSFYPALVIGSYATLTALITALGRVELGVGQALDSRYRLHSLFFYLALVAFLAAIYSSFFHERCARRRRLFLATCSALAAVAFLFWMAACVTSMADQSARYLRQTTMMRALQWIEVIPDNPDLQLIYPIVSELAQRIRVLREHRLLRLRFATSALGQKVREHPLADAGELGHIETCAFSPNGELQVAGWVRPSYRDWRTECIVVVCEDAAGARKPVSVFAPEAQRGWGEASGRDAAVFSKSIDPANLPAGDLTVTVVFADLVRKKVRQLGERKHFRAHER